MTLHAFTDGASRGNPGESGIGLVVRTETGDPVFSLHGYIGTATNNIAEYTALLTLLDAVRVHPCLHLVVHSDSELMVKQINGAYKVRDGNLKRYHRKATELMAALPFSVEVVHVPREVNREADMLANKGIDDRTPIRTVAPAPRSALTTSVIVN